MKNNHANRVCNSLNCFHAYEYLSQDDTIEYPMDCRFCSYDFNRLQVSRFFLRHELENTRKSFNKKFKEKIYEFIIKVFAILSGAIILIYLLNYFRLLSK